MSKFENVPDWLSEHVVRKVSDDRYLNAAGWVIYYYLRKDVTKGFFIPAGSNERLWHKHVNGVVLVGESLFLMRNEVGFVELCARLRHRDFRSTYFEMLAAREFWLTGYRIHFRSAIRGRRLDFDFSATCGGETVNIEVKALTAPRYSSNTVMNALNEARKQLPNDAPAVVYCALPDAWMSEFTDWDARMKDIANCFFRGTRRVNAVIFWAEQSADIPGSPGAGVLVYVSKHYLNSNPYFTIGNTDFMDAGLLGNVAQLAQLAASSKSTLDSLVAAANSTEFFRWVDHVTIGSGVDHV